MPVSRRRYVPLLLSLTLLLSGCALPWAQGATTKTPVALPDAQQIFRPLMDGVKNGDLDSLDPALIQFGTDYTLAQLIFPPLLTLDDHNQVAPWGADSWGASADGLTWTFHLRGGMRWSDGVPIDASTYAYSLNRSLDPCTGSGVASFLSGSGPELIAGSVAFTNSHPFGQDRYGNALPCPPGTLSAPDTLIGKSILAPDPQTLVLRLSHPAAYLPASLTYATAWAQPKQLIEKYGIDTFDQVGQINHRGWTDHLAGFGGNLFKVTRWDHAGHLDLVRNEAFWGAKPKLREIDATLYNDPDRMWADYKAGKGDYVTSPPAAEISFAKKLPGFHDEPDATIRYLVMGWTMPPFDDLRVRQAFDLALDRAALAQLPGNERMIPSIHMVPQGVPGYNPNLADPEGRVGNAVLGSDVPRAQALWESYVSEKCSGQASKCPPVLYAYSYPTPSVEWLLRQWRAALPGITITLYDGCHTQVCKLRPYHLRLAGWIADYPDPQDFLSLLVHTGSPFNQTYISVPAADALMDQADVNPDQAQRLQQYQQAEQLLVDAVAWIPTGQNVNMYLVRPHVAGGYHERASESTALAVWQRIYLIKA